jgi:hypothetical protein
VQGALDVCRQRRHRISCSADELTKLVAACRELVETPRAAVALGALDVCRWWRDRAPRTAGAIRVSRADELTKLVKPPRVTDGLVYPQTGLPLRCRFGGLAGSRNLGVRELRLRL